MIISILPIKQFKLAHKKSTTYQGHIKNGAFHTDFMCPRAKLLPLQHIA